MTQEKDEWLDRLDQAIALVQREPRVTVQVTVPMSKSESFKEHALNFPETRILK